MSDLTNLIVDARQKLRFDAPLGPGDALLVDLHTVRGQYAPRRLLYTLGIVSPDGALEEGARSSAEQRSYVLFGGHRGCGKSTELRRLSHELTRPDRFYVVFVDALRELDVGNLRYSDVLLAQARCLFEQLENDGIALEEIYLQQLQNWFRERVETHQATREFLTELKASMQGSGGIPLLFKLIAELHNSVRIASTHREEIRTVLRNSFSEFAAAFNQLLAHAANRVQEAHRGRAILFVVDGTDRLTGEDSRRLFVEDVHQLQTIEGNFVYCAPIDVLTEASGLHHTFTLHRLPMVKLYDKQAVREANNAVLEDAYGELRKLVKLRVSDALFESENVVERLIKLSGGHPRDLIRLVDYSLQEAFGEKVGEPAANAAIKALASEYRRTLEHDDYQRLVDIDSGDEDYAPNDERSRRLLYSLALLEYNDFWWQSHPAVRELPGYRTARDGA